MLPIFALLMGCNPQDAEVSDGHWFAWIAANSSNIVREEVLTFIKDDVSEHPDGAPDVQIYDCSDRGWNRFQDQWDPGYIGGLSADNAANDGIIGGSCICGEDDTPSCSELTADNCAPLAECDDIKATEFHRFLNLDGFYLLQQEMNPWRSEAVINGEGNLQLTIHNELPEGEDFRFQFSIDPNFRPVTCTTDNDGNAKVEYVDGAEWVDEWSADEDGYQIYYLNAGAYQLNPTDTEDYWYLVNEWNSGFGMARFAGEEFNVIPTWYGNYENDPTSGFMYVQNRNDPNTDSQTEQIQSLRDSSVAWAAEMHTTSGASVGETAYFEHKVEDNLWRPINSTNSGLDGWGELHSSWVRIKDGSTIEPGGSVEGDLQIVYQAIESNSRILVKTSFKINSLKEDPWAYPILEDSKRDEYETPYCGGAELGE
jgi:hypothetical protein